MKSKHHAKFTSSQQWQEHDHERSRGPFLEADGFLGPLPSVLQMQTTNFQHNPSFYTIKQEKKMDFIKNVKKKTYE